MRSAGVAERIFFSRWQGWAGLQKKERSFSPPHDLKKVSRLGLSQKTFIRGNAERKHHIDNFHRKVAGSCCRCYYIFENRKKIRVESIKKGINSSFCVANKFSDLNARDKSGAWVLRSPNTKRLIDQLEINFFSLRLPSCLSQFLFLELNPSILLTLFLLRSYLSKRSKNERKKLGRSRRRKRRKGIACKPR